jgi:hypothetical protein
MTWTAPALAAGLAAALTLAGSAAAATPQSSRDCFFAHQWRGWNATPEGDALYLRVSRSEVYRVELSPGARVRKRASEFLVNRLHGSNSICSHLDLQLAIADDFGFERPLIARSLVKLSPEEAAAIPRKHQP